MTEKRKFDEVTVLNALLCLGVIVIHLTSIPVELMDRGTLFYLLAFSLNRFLIFKKARVDFLRSMDNYFPFFGVTLFHYLLSIKPVVVKTQVEILIRLIDVSLHIDILQTFLRIA